MLYRILCSTYRLCWIVDICSNHSFPDIFKQTFFDIKIFVKQKLEILKLFGMRVKFMYVFSNMKVDHRRKATLYDYYLT